MKKKLKEVKEEIFFIIKNIDLESPSNYLTNSLISYTIDSTRKKELIGVLPSALIDRTRFPKNQDVVKLVEMSLDFKVERWGKSSREEIVGRIISELANKNEDDIELFLNAWKEFEQTKQYALEEGKNNSSNSKQIESKDFVDVWLDFFDKYKGVQR
jgi:hypothetical protein